MSNDYLRLIFLQIERVNSSKPNELYEASLNLLSLCQPLSDDDFKKTISNIQEELESSLRWEEEETDYYQIAGRKILDVCISLLKRKGKIEG
jgi:hypothetical protein